MAGLIDEVYLLFQVRFTYSPLLRTGRVVTRATHMEL